MAARKPQLELFKKDSSSSAYGGELLKTRKGRSRPRPLDTRNTMHLVLRSTKAKGPYSFKKPENEKKIRKILTDFAQKYGIQILRLANVGNHLHLQLKLTNRHTYQAFIRATTGSIAMAVTGASRWTKSPTGKFWDYRPFTRIIQGYRAFLSLKDYIQVNQLEGLGYNRIQARLWLARRRSDSS